MSGLSDEQKAWLDSFLVLCENNESKLSTWEKSFVTDQKERYEQYGDGIRISPKQWGILNRIDAKLNGEG